VKIAFTYNLKSSSSIEEAEFDTKETIDKISEIITSLGHQVDLIDVGRPVSLIISKIESSMPDLIFNTAEGKYGRYREAFYPGIFEQLNIPYTGSDSYVCNLTLDKFATKVLMEREGIPTPKSIFIKDIKDLDKFNLRFPLILKPNYEGSSKGITQDSVVLDYSGMVALLENLLKQFPVGILIEEYIVGKDITVPFIEGVGVLTPCEYVFDKELTKNRKYEIYDYELKNENSNAVDVRVPAKLSKNTLKKIQGYTKTIINYLGIRDLGRIDFRVTDSEEIYFIEINALPSLEMGAGIYVAAEYAGLKP